MKFFIASPWRNKSRVEELHEALTAGGYQCYSFLQSGANLMEGISIEEEIKMFTDRLQDWKHNPDIKKIFESELEGLRQSDAVILLEPAGRSSLLEAGAAFGMGKKVFVVGTIEKPEVALLGANGFYGDISTFLNDLPNIAAA
ncbi:MAG TPA: hypothetical protein VIJ29_04610 [Candidatus Paceibacterota bacterium]